MLTIYQFAQAPQIGGFMTFVPPVNARGSWFRATSDHLSDLVPN